MVSKVWLRRGIYLPEIAAIWLAEFTYFIQKPIKEFFAIGILKKSFNVWVRSWRLQPNVMHRVVLRITLFAEPSVFAEVLPHG